MCCFHPPGVQPPLVLPIELEPKQKAYSPRALPRRFSFLFFVLFLRALAPRMCGGKVLLTEQVH